MKIDALQQWLDRHHVEIVRTHATNLDGMGLGKYLHRKKFVSSLPVGHGVADMALGMDLAGSPHLTFWDDFRQDNLGDVFIRPDLSTLISDATDSNLGHCIADFADRNGNDIDVCPRNTLKRMIREVEGLGYEIKTSFEVEFFLFNESFTDARKKGYRDLTPACATRHPALYNLRNAYLAKPFMDEVIKRLNWMEIPWEAWNDENGLGQIELNLQPCDALRATDHVVRIKQVLYEVATDLGHSVTFMAKPAPGYSSGLHIHHSLTRDGNSAFFDNATPDNRSAIMHHWLGGIMKTLPAAVSWLCPTINAYRRMVDFTAVPVTPTWGEENKSTAIRLISRSANLARIEHRVGSADLNPYLAMAVILAGGLAGLRDSLSPPDEFTKTAWGLPPHFERLPDSLSSAADALDNDPLLKDILGERVVNYWINSRRLEWLAFHTEGGDPGSKAISDWEYERYFEIV